MQILVNSITVLKSSEVQTGVCMKYKQDIFVNSKDRALTCQFDRAGIKKSKPQLKNAQGFKAKN